MAERIDKRIEQLDPKTTPVDADLLVLGDSEDLFEVTKPTTKKLTFARLKAWITAVVSIPWGHITGTLSDQTDLQNALDAKVDNYSSTTVTTNTTINGTYSTYISNSSNALIHTLIAISGNAGKRYTITNIGSGACTITGNGAETINGYNSIIIGKGESITVEAYASGWIII